ncbi:glycerate kinase [Caldicellulosiruptoraceae bacterium PP1]
MSGKSTIGLSKLAEKYNKPVIVLPGSVDCPFELYSKSGVTSVFSVVDMASPLERCLIEAERLLYETAKSLVNLIIFIENKKLYQKKDL